MLFSYPERLVPAKGTAGNSPLQQGISAAASRRLRGKQADPAQAGTFAALKPCKKAMPEGPVARHKYNAHSLAICQNQNHEDFSQPLPPARPAKKMHKKPLPATQLN